MKLILFIAILLPFTWGCKKKTPVSNDSEVNGYANSFACMVNGEEWVAHTSGNPNGPSAVRAEFYAPDSSLTIKGNLENGENSSLETIFFALKGVANAGLYNMVVNQGNIVGFESLNSNNCGVYYHDSISIGQCNILLIDPHSHHVEGTFHMQLFNSDCPDSIMTITNGHFSTYYQ